jgi:O-antigen ligase
LLLIASAVLIALQLIPLPPGIWSQLPGNQQFNELSAIIGGSPPWRPIALVPSGAINSLASLIVPFATFFLMSALSEAEQRRLVAVLLAAVVATVSIGLLQFSGVVINNPFIGAFDPVSGTFSNHNHFALLVAIGCILAPVWAISDQSRSGWKLPIAVALVLLFALTILASGSRAGMVLGVVGLVCGMLIVWREVRRRFSRYPRWLLLGAITFIAVIGCILVFISVSSDRAISIDRAFAVDPKQDMRHRGLPTVVSMVFDHFPLGSGFGSFDPLFRMKEPLNLLGPSYFNHAHNDFLEVVLNGGLAGLALLIASIGWWAWASWRAWRLRPDPADTLAKLGSSILLLVMLASVVDYPARTPAFMAIIVIAAMWLGARPTSSRKGASALPSDDYHL